MQKRAYSTMHTNPVTSGYLLGQAAKRWLKLVIAQKSTARFRPTETQPAISGHALFERI